MTKSVKAKKTASKPLPITATVGPMIVTGDSWPTPWHRVYNYQPEARCLSVQGSQYPVNRKMNPAIIRRNRCHILSNKNPRIVVIDWHCNQHSIRSTARALKNSQDQKKH